MSLADRYAEFIYRIATTRSRLKIIMTPVGIIFWFGLSVVFVLASLWLDKLLPVHRLISPPANLFLSVPLLVIGSGLCLWTVYSFFRARGSPVPLNPPKKLVTTGLYAYIRNPMLLGWIILLFGLGILLNSISLIFILTPLFILLNILYLKTIEEKEMEKKFGQDYLEYRKIVPMFIPRFGRRKQCQ
ncbi:MAG: isoprenylcysteine carboxylmethyltransferase family protein [Dehalococcoidales bacterium]